MVPCPRAGTNEMGFLNKKQEQIIQLNPIHNTSHHTHQTNSTHKNWSNKPPRHQSVRPPTIRHPTIRPQTIRPQTIKPKTSNHPTPQTKHKKNPKEQANTTHQIGKRREKNAKKPWPPPTKERSTCQQSMNDRTGSDAGKPPNRNRTPTSSVPTPSNHRIHATSSNTRPNRRRKSTGNVRPENMDQTIDNDAKEPGPLQQRDASAAEPEDAVAESMDETMDGDPVANTHRSTKSSIDRPKKITGLNQPPSALTRNQRINQRRRHNKRQNKTSARKCP